MSRKNTDEILCAYCEKSVATTNPDEFICKKHGVVAASGRCRAFIYDPQKRPVKPRRQLASIDDADADSE